MAATVAYAIELLTNPANKTGMTDSTPRALGFVQVDGAAVLRQLIEAGAPSEPDARGLAREALEQLGGEDRSYFHQSKGLPASQRREQRIELYWVPTYAMQTGAT